MANYLDLQKIANDKDFQGRCLYALEVQAIFTMNNVHNLSPQIVSFCTQVTSGIVSGYQIALAVLAASAVAAEATVASLPGCTSVPDPDILSAIAIAFNALAGIPAA